MTFRTLRTGLLALLIGLVCSQLGAQTLTPAQLTTLRTHIQASGDLNTLTRFSTINPSLAAVRAGINAAFSGTVPGDVATRLAIFQEAQRRATRFEKLYAVGSGTSTTNAGVGPSTLVIEGAVSGAVVNSARQ